MKRSDAHSGCLHHITAGKVWSSGQTGQYMLFWNVLTAVL